MKSWKVLGLLAALAGLVVVAFLWSLWQPERQVTKHTENFLLSVERKNWRRFNSFIHENYADQWGQDRETITSHSQEAFKHFFDARITAQQPVVEAAETTGRYTAVIRVDGTGTPVAQLVKERANLLNTPFVFHWKRTGWQPWKWQLTMVENENFEMPQTRF